MTKIFRATMILGAALVFVLSAADKAREQTLQRAIDLMESKGDLAKAMPLFEDAARSSDRAVAARALLYLGQAQERQGTEKARATYQRIVKEFSNQTETVAAAQKRLAALGGPGTSGVLAKRLLCAECGDSDADFSSDGRLMVFTSWDTGDLAIRDMSTGKVKRLLAKPGTWKDSPADCDNPVFSRDLRQIVYQWDPNEKDQNVQLRIMPNEPGAKARILVDNPEYTWYNPTAWSPDGKSVLVLFAKGDRTEQLARVSVADGAVKVLKSMDWRMYQTGARPVFSLDGRHIAYNALAVNPTRFPSSPAPVDPKDEHIFVMVSDGSAETEVVKTSGINRNPIWTPDGKHILFTSDRSGKFDLWSIAMQDGKALGSAKLLSPDIGDINAAGMHGGSFYYTNYQKGLEYVNIAEFAPGDANQNRLARPTETFIGIRPSWSPDGKSIAFKRHHPGTKDQYDLVVHSLENGDERTYLTNLGTTGNGAPQHWRNGGKAVMVGLFSRGQSLTYSVDLGTGDFNPMPNPNLPSVLSPDGSTVYIARNDDKDWDKLPARIRAMDLSTGREKDFFTMPETGYAWFLLTPDGRTLVILRQDPKTHTVRFSRLNIDGTGYREIHSLPRNEFRNNFTLTNDGRWILLAKRNEDKNWQLLRVPIEGGAPVDTGIVLDATLYDRSIALSPDGSRIAYSTSKRSTAELWTLDNVLSVLK